MKGIQRITKRDRGGTECVGGLGINPSPQEAARRACLSMLDFEDVPEEGDLPTGLRKAPALPRGGKEK